MMAPMDDATGGTDSAALQAPWFHNDVEPVPVPPLATGTVPTLALICGLVSATWWFLIWLVFMVKTDPNNISGWVLAVGMPIFAVWIVGLILAHRGFSRQVRRTTTNRVKLIAAFVLIYAQAPLIIIALGLAALGALFLGPGAVVPYLVGKPASLPKTISSYSAYGTGLTRY